jgi:acyl-CoA synthetase (AMP-forming)/AMP-acid ligase II
MGDLVERMRWSDPDRVILTGFTGAAEDPEHAALTVARADDLANQCANAVRAHGLAPGEIIAMACENSIEAILTKIGLAKAGVTVAAINPHLAPDVITELLTLTGASWVILDAEFVPRIGGVFEAAGVPTLTTIAVGGPLPEGHTSFSKFVSEAPTAEPDVTIHGDDIWQVQFTSGTSALPKGVMVSHTKTMIESLAISGALTRGQRFESNLVVGGFLPIIYHVGDITLYAALLTGGSAIIGRRANPTELAHAIDRHRITGIWAGSPQIIEELDAALRAEPSLDATSVTSIVHGFAPLAPASYASLKHSLGPQVLITEIIGQTEVCCAHRFWLDEHDELYRRSAPQQNYVGLPHPTMASAITRGDGTPVEAGSGETGEAVYRSPALMAGYLNNPEATAAAFRGGWFHGGDAFCEGENGQRMLVDRFKDVIKTGGENVSSIRVESVLMQHPAVARAAVIGLPHPRWGEAVTAVVRTVDDKTCSEPELIEFAKSRVAGFETPKAVVFVSEFPQAVGNKIQKHKLRQQHAEHYQKGP